MQSMRADDELPENPRERANPLSALMFCFAMPILFKGRKKTLEQTDLYKALKEHKSETLGDRLARAWDDEVVRKTRQKQQPSLLRVLIRVFGWHFALLGLIQFIVRICFILSQPICLYGIMSYFAGDDASVTKAHLYAAGLIAGIVSNITWIHPYTLGILHFSMKMRLALCSLVYRKSLRLSRTALGDTNVGQMVNLMSNDVGRFENDLYSLHFLWLAPLELIIITYFMYDQIGISSLFGMGAMLLFLPFQSYIAYLTGVLRLRTALRTDERVRMMNEVISGIQVIKMYAWEKPVVKLVELMRRKEMNVIKQVNYVRGVLISSIMFLSRISIFTSLGGYVLLGHLLTAEKAFFITAYYNILQRSVTRFFPRGISVSAELLVSITRLETFMLQEEVQVRDKLDELNVLQSQTNDFKTALLNDNDKDAAKAEQRDDATLIGLRNFHARWVDKSAEDNLSDINLQLSRKQLVAIIGSVGAGKSSLIQAVLGELPPLSGSITVNGSYSYAAQEPWLFTGSVRQNILFGLPMDKQRYRSVVQHCALERDFELLSHGDKTIVGERGASLSGGQKARINLARAVYRKADIYLLDDPLSAVDMQVGRDLFDQCILGLLHNKLVILVTHQLQFLNEADLIVIMDQGRISAMGTYDTIQRSGLDFAQLLTNPKHSKVEAEDDAAGGDNRDRPSMDLSRSRHNSRGSHASRQISCSSLNSLVESLNMDAPMEVQEVRVKGKIGLRLYKEYLTAGSGWLIIFFILFLCLGTQIVVSGTDFFLSYWINKNKNAANIASDPMDFYYFTALNIAVIIFTLVRTQLFYKLAMRSSTSLHNSMFRGIIRAAMYFFNTNPSGRILNRFSKDLGDLDEILPSLLLGVVEFFLLIGGIIVVICIMNPWNIFVTILLVFTFYYLRDFFLTTSRDIKRMEAVARSAIYSHVTTSISGLSTIRALGAQQALIAEFDNFQDMHSSSFYSFLSTNRAFAYYIECCCAIYVVIIILSFFINPPVNSGEVGLAITQAMGLAGLVQFGMLQSALLENAMTAVERIIEYDEIEPEGEYESKSEKQPPPTWPEQGTIVADDLSLRYLPDPKAEHVLKSLNFNIKPMEKVGIVGRTGAGKSSLINALFRLSYNDGLIFIDSRNTSELGLHDLRSKISIIPQEPVLFSGTVRYNLDPIEEYNDAKLWAALEDVKLKQFISEMDGGLNSKIFEGGTNFSVGQRQLVCLARAILRENRILVLDEATANVDPQTDEVIQTTIRNKFRDCTVLTIAHRLHTIMDSDRVMVMDAGQLVEFGSPYELLTDCKTRIFHSMVMQAGQITFDSLLKVAEKAHFAAQKPKSN